MSGYLRLLLVLTVALPAAGGCDGCREDRGAAEAPRAATPAAPSQPSPAPAARPDAVEMTERARGAVERFRAQLQEALAQAMARGPAEAITVCSEVAPELARELSTEGLKIRRTSHKLRNPDNAPPRWVKPVLDQYVRSPRKTGAYQTRQLEGGGLGLVEPIYAKAPCLTCHGANIAPSVAKRLEQLYPTDKARGFEAGDLRGLFWVEVRTGDEKDKRKRRR